MFFAVALFAESVPAHCAVFCVLAVTFFAFGVSFRFLGDGFDGPERLAQHPDLLALAEVVVEGLAPHDGDLVGLVVAHRAGDDVDLHLEAAVVVFELGYVLETFGPAAEIVPTWEK